MNKEFNRRNFIKIFGASAVGIGLAGGLNSTGAAESLNVEKVLPVLEKIVEDRQPVIWFQGAGCTGCSVSLLNTVHPDIAEVLTKIISLEAHQTVMASSGEQALGVFEEACEKKAGKFILIVEGAVPTAENGRYGFFGESPKGEQTILSWVKKLGNAAKAVVAVGTCAAFGGIPSAQPNIIGAKSVAEVLGKQVVNVPGCPPHPDWIVGTLAHVLLFGLPELDEEGRPKLFYGNTIHANCPRYFDFENKRYANNLGDDGCLVFLGCKGPIAHADCSQRRWNNSVNWCIGSNAPCIGCVQPEFPDDISPLYTKLPDEKIWINKSGVKK
ncbi:MAG: hydrogenase small subunit [Desulfobacterales bacterium]|nr:hydrogenase small subunit [Desulfobacterales bacterium]